MKPSCIGQSNTNNLPAPTDLTENPYGKKNLFFFKDATQKSASVVHRGSAVELVPRRPIFEKCPHLREKGGVLMLRTPRWVCADPYSKQFPKIWAFLVLFLRDYLCNHIFRFVSTLKP
jgi:hypothetical protein